MDTSSYAPTAPLLPQDASTLPPRSEQPSHFQLKIQSVPKDYLSRPLEEWEKARPKIWQRKPFFFYGTLKEPQTLSRVLDKPVSPSSLRPAYVEGYSIEMWGQYKALVTGPQGNIIEGMAYDVQSEEDEEKLAFTKPVPTMSRRVSSTSPRQNEKSKTTPKRSAGRLSGMREMHGL